MRSDLIASPNYPCAYFTRANCAHIGILWRTFLLAVPFAALTTIGHAQSSAYRSAVAANRQPWPVSVNPARSSPVLYSNNQITRAQRAQVLERPFAKSATSSPQTKMKRTKKIFPSALSHRSAISATRCRSSRTTRSTHLDRTLALQHRR